MSVCYRVVRVSGSRVFSRIVRVSNGHIYYTDIHTCSMLYVLMPCVVLEVFFFESTRFWRLILDELICMSSDSPPVNRPLVHRSFKNSLSIHLLRHVLIDLRLYIYTPKESKYDEGVSKTY